MKRHFNRIASLVALAAASWPATAPAADVSIAPTAGSGFVVKDANNAADRLRVNEDGKVWIPILATGAQQATPVCAGADGALGPCAPATSATSYGAGTGLALAASTFSIASSYQLPQSCTANQLAQWNGMAWACAAPSGGGTLPPGMANQTLRYDGGNALAATSDWQVFPDGGVLATNAAVNAAIANLQVPVGTIPAEGPGARMMWYPAKAAFRAGYASSNQWDDANVGSYSTAMGYATFASGLASTAMGYGTSAIVSTSTAMGFLTTASGSASTAMGNGTSAGGENSTAMGHGTEANGLYTLAVGSFVNAEFDRCAIIGWAAIDEPAGCVRSDEVMIHAANGLEVGYGNNWVIVGANNVSSGKAIATSTGAFLSSGGTWTNASDRNKKENFIAVDGAAVLEKVLRLPLSTWSYKSDQGKYRHLGPMAQDFKAVFDLGQDDTSISTIDPAGVALAAIQGLAAQRDKDIAAMRESNAQKDRAIAAQAKQIAELRIALADARMQLATGLAQVKADMARLRQAEPAAASYASLHP